MPSVFGTRTAHSHHHGNSGLGSHEVSVANSSTGPTSIPVSSNLARTPSFPTPSLLRSIGLSQPTLNITLREPTVFLSPTSPDEPTYDPVVQGKVTLHLPKPRALKQLSVKLTGKQEVYWSDKIDETNICLDREVNLVTGEDLKLDKGSHEFEFSFIVPSNNPTWERCTFGKVKHFIVAKAIGLGPMNSDVSSAPKEIFFELNPGEAGENAPPPDLDLRHEGVVDHLGPYTLALQSQHTMVGGLLLVRFNLLAPGSDLFISSLKVKILQHFELHSLSRPEIVLDPPTEILTVTHLDATRPPNFGVVHEFSSPSTAARTDSTKEFGQLKFLSPGQEWKIFHLERLPGHKHLRSSTHVYSESCIRVRHEVALELIYRVPKPEELIKAKGKHPANNSAASEFTKERKKLVVSKTIQFFSCACFVQSLSLPAYSAKDEKEEDAPFDCICGYKFKDVIRFHGQELLRSEGEQGISFIHHRKDGTLTPTTPPTRNAFLRTNSSNSTSSQNSSHAAHGLSDLLHRASLSEDIRN